MAFWHRSIRPPDIPNDNPAGVPPAASDRPTTAPATPRASWSSRASPHRRGSRRRGPRRGTAGPPSGTPPAGARSPRWPTRPGRASTSTPGCCPRWPRIWWTSRRRSVADWLTNPQPLTYSSWEEFAKQLVWNYLMVGETFVLATAWYATGYPARFHVVPPHLVEVEIAGGVRRYTIGGRDETDAILHLRYQSSVDDAHGHGPLEAGGARLVAAETLMRYGTNLAAGGGIPSSVLEHPDELKRDQAEDLQAQWMAARLSKMGEPAVLSGGVKWSATSLNPKDMALIELAQHNESRIAILLGVPPFLVGLPSGGDPMTYQNVQSIFDYHWRSGLRPLAQTLMAGLSNWALPRGVSVEVNSDAYVRPDPQARALIYQTMNNTRDTPTGPPAMSVSEIREAERLDRVTPDDLEVLG